MVSFYRLFDRRDVIRDIAVAREGLKEMLLEAIVTNRKIYGVEKVYL
ncbi:MAG: hypothetical protein M0019_00355 [Actinomycetota bacterium]|nr:hypothetical protein [Actinomycetota bacterium]